MLEWFVEVGFGFFRERFFYELLSELRKVFQCLQTQSSTDLLFDQIKRHSFCTLILLPFNLFCVHLFSFNFCSWRKQTMYIFDSDLVWRMQLMIIKG